MRTFLYGLALLALWAVCYNAIAEPIHELIMKTDVGEVVLTDQECIFKKMGLQGYEYAAYATEKGHANHEGCWRKDMIDGKSSVQIYFPEIDATAVYNPALFKPRATI